MTHNFHAHRKMMISSVLRFAIVFFASVILVDARGIAEPIAGADPLTVAIRTDDADRFASLFDKTGGTPSAEQLQREYLDLGTHGVKVFTPHRIKSAAELSSYIARKHGMYRTAIDQCLPVAKKANPELRAIFLALRGLYPSRPLPEMFIVFGRGNSGGTADTAAQVLGIEVLCHVSPTPESLQQRLRMMFAHETVHTWQSDEGPDDRNILLRAALREGAADYIASLVLGRPPSLERDAWAPQREAELWRQFITDVQATRSLTYADYDDNEAARAARSRWIGNYGAAPDGWPYEMGYWIGMRIWQRYVDAAPDKRAAIEHVLTWTDPEEVLKAGRLPE